MDNLLISIFSPFILLAVILTGFAIMTGSRPGTLLRPMMTLVFSILKLAFDITIAAVKAIKVPANGSPASYSGQRAPNAQRTHHQGVSEQDEYNSRSRF